MENSYNVLWKIRHDESYKQRFLAENKDKILLKRLLIELDFCNELITDSETFAIDVMSWADRIERMEKGIEEMPDKIKLSGIKAIKSF